MYGNPGADTEEQGDSTPVLSGSEEPDSDEPPLLWYHIVINTRSSWLHGDPRGFRSRDGRILSSGDYKHPPPPGEHADLHRYQLDQSQSAVVLPRKYWPVIGRTLVEKVQSQDHRLLAVAVDAHHAHLHVELPADRKKIKRLAGTWKQAASHAVKHVLPGSIWSQGCDSKAVRDERHHRHTFRYVLSHADQGAWTWRFDEVDACEADQDKDTAQEL